MNRTRPPRSFGLGSWGLPSLGLTLLLASPLIAVRGGDLAFAQEPISADVPVTWTLFVSATGSNPARRETISAREDHFDLPLNAWSCRYGVPNRARVDSLNWSETRSLECVRGDSVVSTTGFCQVSGSSWGARAAVLSLGTVDSPSRLSVSLDCEVEGR